MRAQFIPFFGTPLRAVGRGALALRWVLALAWLLALGSSGGCADPSATERASEVEEDEREIGLPSPPHPDDEGIALGIPPGVIGDARREASGLLRLPESARVRALQQGRERAITRIEALGEQADSTRQRASVDGRVGLVRPAGPGLWIMVLMTRQTEAGWRDPIYVLGLGQEEAPVAEAARVRVDGWALGLRTVGQHRLPLVVAFAFTPREAAALGPLEPQ